LLVACTTIVSFLLSAYYRADFNAVVQRLEATFFSSDGIAAGQRHGRYLESIVSPNDFSIVFSTLPATDQTAYDGNSTTPSPPTHTKFVMPPMSLDEDSLLDAMQRDDGGLFIFIPEDETLRLQPRTIFHDFEEDQVYQNLINGPNDDDWIDNYYAFDDDANRNPYMAYEDADLHKDKQCRRTKWHRDMPIDCNKMHEFDTETRFRSGDTSFLGYVPRMKMRAV
jgi:hypothetical protein